MSRIVYINGSYIPEENATLSIFDRSVLFSDSVYEVTSILDEKLLDFHGHMDRLARSLSELRINFSQDRHSLLEIHRELIKQNNIDQGMIYLQVSRGNALDRDYHFPSENTQPTLFMFTQDTPGNADNPKAKTGLRIISIEDQRWARRDIKTTQLLAPSLGKMMARDVGCDDAWMVEDGFVTEGTSNNAFIVRGNVIITRSLGTEILPGITRLSVLKFAKEHNFEIEERNFTIEEAKTADEAFITSSMNFVMPVVEIDGDKIGNGTPGPISYLLRKIYLEEARKNAI